jgi:hypothetical protein
VDAPKFPSWRRFTAARQRIADRVRIDRGRDKTPRVVRRIKKLSKFNSERALPQHSARRAEIINSMAINALRNTAIVYALVTCLECRGGEPCNEKIGGSNK